MPDLRPARRPITPIRPTSLSRSPGDGSELVPSARPAGLVPGTPSRANDQVLCERCGAEVYRMHAVWRCPACGFKSDCCGW